MGAVLVKEERQQKLSCTCVGWPWIFLVLVVTLDASTGDFVVSILVQRLIRGVILLHDNLRPHAANTITVLLQKFKLEILGHPPYSLDLSPCDYAIFGPLKKALRGKRFTLDDDVKQYVRNWFTTQPREFYETAIRRLMSQWDKCLNSQGQYF